MSGDSCGTLDQAGWRLLSFATPALYDLARIAPVPEGMNPVAAMAVAEKLRGTLRLHAGYAVAADDTRGPARHTNQALVPHLRGVAPRALAQAVAQGKPVPMTTDGVKARLTLPREAAPLIAGIDGRRSLAELAAAARMDPLRFGAAWGPAARELADWGLLLYSTLLRR